MAPSGVDFVIISTGAFNAVKTLCTALVINRRGKIPTEPGFVPIAAAMLSPDTAKRAREVIGCPFITV